VLNLTAHSLTSEEQILPFALIFNYVLYEKPQFFPAALLALNSAGTCSRHHIRYHIEGFEFRSLARCAYCDGVGPDRIYGADYV